MGRWLDSRHIDTAVGGMAHAFGVFVVICFLVGLANVIAWIAETL